MPVSSLQDLWRSKNRYSSSIAAATTSFATATFTIMLGTSIGVRIDLTSLSKASVGFRGIFSSFILITIVFSFILSLITFTNLTATMMNNRSKDIAILKASGGSIHKIYSHFITQVIELSLIVGGLSIFIGVLIYSFVYFILNYLLGLSLQFSIPSFQLLATLLILIVSCIIFSHRYVARAARVRVAETLSPQIRNIEILSTEGWFERRISKPGSPARIAFRNVKRTKPFALRLAACIFLSMIITTSITVGGVVGDQTTVSYVRRAISEDFIFVGHQEMWVQYSSLVGFQTSPAYNPNFNYTRIEYEMNASTIANIALLPGVTGVDPRLICETTLRELKVPVITGENQYQMVGDDRSAKVLVSGVEPDKVISDWLISGRFINSSDYPNVPRAFSRIAIGDSLETIFEDTTIEKASILGKEFTIAGSVLDPINSGWTVYMLHSALANTTPTFQAYNGYNMALVRCNPNSYASTLSIIQNNLTKYGLSAFPMRPVVLDLIDYVHSTWLTALVPAILLILTLILSVISYINLTFETEKRDFGVMRGIGATPRHIRKTIMTQGIVVSAWPGVAGILTGLIISLWFLVPAATASLLSIILSIALLLALLFSASVLASSIISRRTSRKPTMEIIR
ncbi:MAG: ABC transporter permease [Candidatus Atabeyarchaeum deiterrae]